MARRTKAEAERTREDILDAAERVFFAKGVPATSLADIAQAANVTRGAVYWHFKNKPDVLDAMLERVRFPQEDVVAGISPDNAKDALTTLEEACVGCLRLLHDDPQRQRVFTISMLRCDVVIDIPQHQRETNAVMFERLVRAFEIAEAEGTLASHWKPRVAAQVVSSLCLGLFRDWLEDTTRFEIVDTGITSIQSLFRSFHAMPKPD
ncbi:MAG: TetR family transcriptional regulator [Parvibaculum sp.]|uniref:TetR family transcriptional regulator n=1 Tax=Parvibaculum sp. TaxID=2024848 RepID=UPI003C770B91